MKNRYFSVRLIIIALVVFIVTSGSTKQELVAFSGSSMLSRRSATGKCIAPDRLTICRSRMLSMYIAVDDVRLLGEAKLVFDSIYSKVPYQGYMQGDINLENQGGSWKGTWKGSTDTMGNTFIKGQAQGAGGYEGLSVQWQMKRSAANLPGQMSVNGSLQTVVSLMHKR